MSNQKQSATTEAEHLSEVPDGAGCTEIWDKLSEDRFEETDS